MGFINPASITVLQILSLAPEGKYIISLSMAILQTSPGYYFRVPLKVEYRSNGEDNDCANCTGALAKF